MKLFRAPLVEELHVDAVLLAENIAIVIETFPHVVLVALALTPLTEVAPVKGKPKQIHSVKEKEILQCCSLLSSCVFIRLKF